MAAAIGIRIEGFAKDTTQNDIVLTLAIVVRRHALPQLPLIDVRKHKRSVSAMVAVANKNASKKLGKVLSKEPINGRMLHCGRCPLPTNHQDKVLIQIKASMAKESQPLQRETVSWKFTTAAARSFHQYLLTNPSLLQAAIDRDAVARIFQTYRDSVADSEMQQLLVEPLIMSRLRQLRLLRSRRTGDQVFMFFATADGSFLNLEERQQAQDELRKQKEEAEADKNGVVVSSPPTMVVAPKQSETLVFEIEVNDNPVALVAIRLTGAQRRYYQLTGKRETSERLLKVPLDFGPRHVGVYRCTVEFEFVDVDGGERFTIVRYLTNKCGDGATDRLLQPTAPYQRRRVRAYTKRIDEVLEAPKPVGQSSAANPFQNLPKYAIPELVKAMIVNREMEYAIQWPERGVDGYGNFWKHLLWASELQSYNDIQLFDMESATLQRMGKFLTLQVPGLAEGRPSVLRGDLVHVTWKGRLYKGRVQSTRLLEVVLEFHASFHRQFNPAVDRVDVRFTFSRMTYRTSHKGCVLAEETLQEMPLVPLPQHVAEVEAEPRARGVPGEWRWANRDLNEEQRTAIGNIVDGRLRPLPYIIFGPPGTGKTTTVVEAVYQLATVHELKILLVAPSNDAADLLVERLAPFFPPTEMRRILAYSRSVDAVPSSIRDYVKEGSESEEQKNDVVSARIVVSTVNLASRFGLFGVPTGHFDVLCVDEAGHATEPEVVSVAASLFDLVHAENGRMGQIILAGDPKQLGPIITSEVCRKLGLSMSYMERLMGRIVYARDETGHYPSALLTKLVRNYRSHPSIIELPNKLFYDGDLQCCGDPLSTHNMAHWEHLPRKGFPVLFHCMEGENLREGSSPSWFNPQEAQQCISYVELLLKETRPPLRPDEIGIITPYARQAQKIRLALQSKGLPEIKVGSVECFQGQERRCVIVSTVRSQQEQVSHDLRYNLGFVANEKRFNVAVTRAKTLLIVIGCAQVLAMDEANWLPFLRFCRDNGSWVGEDWVEEEPLATKMMDETQTDDEDAGDGSWDVVDAPSKAAEQEGFAFVSHGEV